MLMKILAGALYAAILAVAAIANADEPTGFRDVPWGASEEILRFRIPTDSCTTIDSSVDFGTRRCRARGDVTFGTIAPSAVFFYFRNDMLVAWRVTSHPRDRETLGKALMQTYGRPTFVYEGDHVTWKGGTSDVDFVGGRSQDIITAVVKAELVIRDVEQQERVKRAGKRF